MTSMRTSLTAALLSVMAASLATGCSTSPKVVDSFCQKAQVVVDSAGSMDIADWRFLVFDDGSVEILRDADGELVSCEWTMRMFPSSE